MKALSHWLILTSVELKSLREGWAWSIGLAVLYPASLLFFLKFSGASSPAAAAFAVPGCVIFSVALNTTLGLAQELAAIRETASMDFYAVLPVSRAQLVGAMLARSILSALPGAAGVLLIGCVFLGFAPAPRVLLALPTLLLCCGALAGFGAVIGFACPSARAANFITQVGYTFIAFFSPVMFPKEALPTPLQWTAYLLPTTYAADAMRSLLSGAALDAAFAADLGVLAAFSAFSLLLLKRRIHWRQN